MKNEEIMQTLEKALQRERIFQEALEMIAYGDANDWPLRSCRQTAIEALKEALDLHKPS